MTNKHIIQRFFWNIAGAEIPILEECRTDHKRFAAVGATIAMTSFIAFLSGTAAAWYFTQSGEETVGNIWLAVAFGLVWCTLIFCIDRSLVITLKKNPERKSKYWWAIPFGSRALLALIIAFMVSIPLELVVFRDFIKVAEFNYNEQQKIDFKDGTKSTIDMKEDSVSNVKAANDINKLEEQKQSLETEISKLEDDLQKEKAKLNHPNTVAYNNADASIRNLERRYGKARGNERKRISDQLRLNRSIKQNEINKWRPTIPTIKQNINQLESEIQDKQKKKADKENSLQKKQEEIEKTNGHIYKSKEERDSLEIEYNKTLQQGNHFIKNFEILEYAVKKTDKNGNLPTEFYFLWLIRLLFFIIEILPTTVKIVMPLGMYDRMVHAEELDMKSYLSSAEYQNRIRSIHEIELKAHEDQLKKQTEAEQEVRLAILEKMKIAQQEIAEAAINKWKEDEVAKIKHDNSSQIAMTPPPIEI